jgi:hypothetical protein
MRFSFSGGVFARTDHGKLPGRSCSSLNAQTGPQKRSPRQKNPRAMAAHVSAIPKYDDEPPQPLYDEGALISFSNQARE